jgi:hypothetical protein
VYELRFGSGLSPIGSDPRYWVRSGWWRGFMPSGLSRPCLLACRASAGLAIGPRTEEEMGRPAGPVQVLTGFRPRVLREK